MISLWWPSYGGCLVVVWLWLRLGVAVYLCWLCIIETLGVIKATDGSHLVEDFVGYFWEIILNFRSRRYAE